MISTPVALLVLLAALMHAGWNYLVKAGGDRLLDTTAIALGASLLAAPMLPFLPLPAPEAWSWLGLTLVLHVGYFYALIQSYRYADLSLAYPLMRGLAPVLVAAIAPLLGEPVSFWLICGVLLVGSGIGLPALAAVRSGQTRWRALGYPALNAGFIAGYTLSDGIGVRLAGDAISYTLWLFFLNAWAILALARWRRGRRCVAALVLRWRLALVGSVMTMGSYGIVLWAMSVASIPAVAALRELSVVFAAVLGAWLLKERMGPWRIAGSLLVAAGAIAIRFS